MKRVFTTAAVAPAQRADAWRDFVSKSFAPVEVGDYAGDAFAAQISAVQLGALDLAHFTGSEQSVTRPQRMIRPSDSDMFVAVVQLSGSVSYAQGSESGSGLVGNVTLFDLARDYRSMFHGGLDFIDVSIPRARLEALLGSTRNLAGLTIGPDQPLTALIIDYFHKQMAVADQLSAESASRLGAIGLDLLVAGFIEKMGRTPHPSVVGAAAIARAKAFIRANLAQSELSPEVVAASENLSLRRMQELFAEERLTISDYIWEQRLLKAKVMLESRAFSRLAVADVANAVGFVSLSHFSRRFRGRFGVTPVHCRHRAMAGLVAAE